MRAPLDYFSDCMTLPPMTTRVAASMNGSFRCCRLATLLALQAWTMPAADCQDGVAFFESKIRPLLIEHCLDCHGGSEPEGGLALDSRAGWEEAGVIEPGKPEESLLIAAVRYSDTSLAMPPDGAGGKLSDAEIAALEEWVALGAPDPRGPAAAAPSAGASAATGPKLRGRKFKLSDADRSYWAFQPIERPALLTVSSPEARHPIDALVLAKLEEHGLSMSPTAPPRELVRRAYFDLWGLPPSPKEVAAFEQNPTEEEWDRLVDRLLASPHYGQRWGRHWLDVVRYAESNGYERDGLKPNAWRYRDYVIDAFNADKPYDQFVREQLAGDELAEELLSGGIEESDSRQAWRDAIVATGFYRLHVWDDEPDNTIVAEYDDLDDVMVSTGAAFLGLTLGCARCHDHKFDPISQRDYYSMLSFFRGIDPYGQHKTGGGGRGTGQITRLLATPAELESWQREQQRRIAELERRLAEASAAADDATPDVAAKEANEAAIEAELKQAREATPPFDSALAAVELGPTAKSTHVLSRGEPQSPREEVSPAFPEVLGLPAPVVEVTSADAKSTRRRRALAEWVADETNPLTARVMANRIWRHHFGVGIVPTPDDFGHTGLPPTNQPLLDYLAAEFMASGWRMKELHRLIMSSRTYRQSSRAENPQALAIDSDNALLWRQRLRRVDAEVIRDAMLSVSGQLNTKQGGPSVFPTLSQETHSGQDAAGKGWQDSPAEEQNRRSVYLAVKRGLKIPLLESLDFANSTSPAGIRPVTTTAPQALMLLNDRFVEAQATAFAARVAQEGGGDCAAMVTRAFQLALQRDPSASERLAVERLLADERRLAIGEGIADPEGRALTSFCRGLLNANEMIYVD